MHLRGNELVAQYHQMYNSVAMMEQSLNLNELAVFLYVAELRSFSAAAAALNLPKSTVSRTIQRLEAQVKAPLLLRSTRHIELTSLGQRLFAACFTDLTKLKDHARQVFVGSQAPTRLVRITAVEDLGSSLLPDIITQFAQRRPELRFDLVLTNEQVNLIREGIDLAVRVGTVQQTAVRKRHLGRVGFILVASPAFLQRSPDLAHPYFPVVDLANRPIMGLKGFGLSERGLTLVSGDKKIRVAAQARVVTTTSAAIQRLVHLNFGIGLLPDFLCRDELASGALLRVCPAWHTPYKKVSLLFTAKAPREALVQELGDHLYSELRRLLAPTQGL